MGIINSNLMKMRKERFSWPLNVEIVPMRSSEAQVKKALPLTLLRPPAADSGKLRGKEPSAVNTHAHAAPVQL